MIILTRSVPIINLLIQQISFIVYVSDITLLEHIVFVFYLLCQLKFMEIMRLSQSCGKSDHYHFLYITGFKAVVDVVTELVREGVSSELLHADCLVLMSETIEGLRNKFREWMEAFESMGLKVNVGKTMVMVSGSITKDGLSKSKVDPCGACGLRVTADTVVCVQCGRWING